MLTMQELSLKREFASIEQAVSIQLSGNWEQRIQEYLADLQTGIASLNDDPENLEDLQEIFQLKRQIVPALVRRITIDCNRELHVEIGLNLLKILNDENSTGFKGKNQGEIEPAGIHPGWRDDS